MKHVKKNSIPTLAFCCPNAFILHGILDWLNKVLGGVLTPLIQRIFGEGN
jgi:hypothetical protein